MKSTLKDAIAAATETAVKQTISTFSEDDIKLELATNAKIIKLFDNSSAALQICAFEHGASFEWINNPTKEFIQYIIDNRINVNLDLIDANTFSIIKEIAPRDVIIEILSETYPISKEFLKDFDEEIQIEVVRLAPDTFDHSSKTKPIIDALLQNTSSWKIIIETENGKIYNPPQELIQIVMLQEIIEK